MNSPIFALFHGRYGPHMALEFFYGWVIGWARLRSGGILASTGLHRTVNGLVTALMSPAVGSASRTGSSWTWNSSPPSARGWGTISSAPAYFSDVFQGMRPSIHAMPQVSVMPEKTRPAPMKADRP